MTAASLPFFCHCPQTLYKRQRLAEQATASLADPAACLCLPHAKDSAFIVLALCPGPPPSAGDARSPPDGSDPYIGVPAPVCIQDTKVYGLASAKPPLALNPSRGTATHVQGSLGPAGASATPSKRKVHLRFFSLGEVKTMREKNLTPGESPGQFGGGGIYDKYVPRAVIANMVRCSGMVT